MRSCIFPWLWHAETMVKELKYVPLSHPLRSIEVDGLPEPVALSLNSMVQTLRRQLAVSSRRSRPEPLLTKSGTVIGGIGRDDIYGDVG